MFTKVLVRHYLTKGAGTDRHSLRNTAPVLDPTQGKTLREALSRGLSQLADGLRRERELQSGVDVLCKTLKKGKRPKGSIRFA